jgi:hypothetical protein
VAGQWEHLGFHLVERDAEERTNLYPPTVEIVQRPDREL